MLNTKRLVDGFSEERLARPETSSLGLWTTMGELVGGGVRRESNGTSSSTDDTEMVELSGLGDVGDGPGRIGDVGEENHDRLV